MPESDGVYVRRTLRGESEAFQFLVEKYSGAVFALVFSQIGRSSEVEDLTQEVFLQAYRSLPNLTQTTRFGSWLYGITKRVCLNWIRKQKSQTVSYGAHESLLNVPDPAERQPREEPGELILGCIHTLPAIYREVVLLRYMEDFSYAEMSEILGIGESAVNVRLIKARKLLREKIELAYQQSSR